MQGNTPKGSWNFAAALATEELLSKCLETMPDVTSLAVMTREGDLLAVTGPSRKALLQNSQFAMGMFGIFGSHDASDELEFNISRTPVGDLLAGCVDGQHVVLCLTRPRADLDRALADLEWLGDRVARVFDDLG
jgi:hypothetical protein